jgi:hypothetical protein
MRGVRLRAKRYGGPAEASAKAGGVRGCEPHPDPHPASRIPERYFFSMV